MMKRGLFVVVCLVMLVAPAYAQDWYTNPANGHRYTVVSADTWEIAEAEAVSLGGHLVTIRSSAENDWVLQTVFDPTNQSYAWIGLYQLPNSPEPADGWVWSSGEPVSYTNWNNGEPNNQGGGENWAEMYSGRSGGNDVRGSWNDTSPSNVHPAIGIVEVVPEPSSVLALLCGIGGMRGLLLRTRKIS